MSVKIRQGFQAEISAKGFGVTTIFAETPELLDLAVEAHFSRLLEVRDAKSKAILARLSGLEKKAYKDARKALGEA